MLSSPEIWREFFERYYEKEVHALFSKIATDGKNAALKVDVLKDLAVYRMELMEEFFEYPEMVIRDARAGLKLCQTPFDAWVDRSITPHVRFVNIPETRRILIKDIRARHISRFISVEGIVTKATSVQPKIVKALYQCNRCGKTHEVVAEEDIVKKPWQCQCKSKSFEMISHEAIDVQKVTIQDFPERLRGGELPVSILVMLHEDLAGKLKPGDRVVINGVVKARQKKSKMDAYMDRWIEANSIEVLDVEYDEIEISREDEQKILELSKQPDLVERIKNSIAPSIYGYDEVKLAIALQLFGGVPKTLPNKVTLRGDIHILLAGDPSTAKSQIMQHVQRIAPRSYYFSGRGATTAGLTAAVTRDDFGKWTIEAGAMVLADKGIVLADEIEKMSPTDRESIHTALEQQIVAISKAGINATLKARCAMLAAINPKHGRFDRYTPLPEQINLDPALLSRFDLIFMLLDVPDEGKDVEIADSVLGVHSEPENVRPPIEPDLLRKYIAYAKKHVKPRLTWEAMRKIKEFYVRMRAKSKDSSMQATVRQLEGIIRLSEAAARMRLSQEVTVEDVDTAIMLIKKSLEHVATDPETGEVDVDYVFSGVPKTQRDRIAIILDIVRNLQNLTDKGAPEDEILERAEARGIDRVKAREILMKLRERGEVFTPKSGHYKLVRD